MRLNAMKLSGFKSFVDLTHIVLKGNIIAVVGPNGCGKSNIIDAIKWVLGESRQSSLRSQSMQDLIFSGSAHRKPVSRASVELSFDNHESGVQGLWSQYTDIAIKRIVTRQGDSTYWINNLPVRKKDVTDLFLGTGIGGGRSYAIIEQGMISKIIEATPDELRFFLEEAAGVSRYQEKRKETEARLKDSQMNLDRLSDIVGELAERQESLLVQAEKAQQYLRLAEEIRVMSLRLYAAQFFFAQHALRLNLEEMTLLQEECHKEESRFSQTEEEVKQKESIYYQVQRELAQQQESLRYTSTTLVEKEKDLFYRQEKIKENKTLENECQTESALLLHRLEKLQIRETEVSSLLEVAEKKYCCAQDQVTQAREALQERAHQKNYLQQQCQEKQKILQECQLKKQRCVMEIQNRVRRLGEDRDQYERLADGAHALVFEEEEELHGLQESLRHAQTQHQEMQVAEEQLVLKEREMEVALSGVKKNYHAVKQNLAQLEGKLAFIDQEKKKSYGMQSWQEAWPNVALTMSNPLGEWLSVDGQWCDALDRLLSEKLRACGVSDLCFFQEILSSDDVSMSESAYFIEVNTTSDEPGLNTVWPDWSQWSPFLTVKDNAPKRIEEILSIWLSPYYPILDWNQAFLTYRALSPMAYYLFPSGALLGRWTLSIVGELSKDKGVLRRESEWRALLEEKESIQMHLSSIHASCASFEAELCILKEERAACHTQRMALLEEVRSYEKRILLLTQKKNTIVVRQQEQEKERLCIVSAIVKVVRELGHYRMQLFDLSQSECMQQHHLSRLQVSAHEADSAYVAFMSGRVEQESALERLASECRELKKEHGAILSEKKRLSDRHRYVMERFEKASQIIASLKDAGEDDILRLREEQVILERDVAQNKEQLLFLQEEKKNAEIRLKTIQQTLLPMKEREKKLGFDRQEKQFMIRKVEEELAKQEMSTNDLVPPPEKGGSISFLKKELTQLEKQLKQMGAVNLTAVEELSAVQERYQYLSAQMADLNMAIASLKEVIGTIDHESSVLLKNMYESVNKKLGELFSVLFEGGEAYLESSDEDFLKARFQIIARPPGKKNKNIHLLSGGEKALTAIAFIFAMFELNPAPFCLLDEVDAPLDDMNTIRLTRLIKRMSEKSQIIFISHNKMTMDVADSLIGVTMPESGVSKVFDLDIQACLALISQ